MGGLPGNGYRTNINNAGNCRFNPRVTCFNSGQRGHYSDLCSNSRVSLLEQQQIRDQVRLECIPIDQGLRQTIQVIEPPLSGANTMELRLRTIM